MCTCKQISRQQARTPGNFNYEFSCKKDDGTKVTIKVSSGNDNEAKTLAEMECAETKVIGRRTKERIINPGISKFHLGEHISTICRCGIDYGSNENGGGGNCAHYVCNKDLWNITNQDEIRFNCPSGYGIQAADLESYCSTHPKDWIKKINASAMTKQGLVFGKKEGRIKHVGIFDKSDSIYHYGFTSNKVLRNNISWWEKEYDSLIFYQRG